MPKNATIFYVYILFRLNGVPCYVGKGSGDRWERHDRCGVHPNPRLHRIVKAAREAGKSLPRVKVAEGLTEREAFDLERRLIGLMGRGDAGPLVNLTDGGEGLTGRHHSESSRSAISAALKGKKKSPAHAAAAAAGQIGSKKKSGWWSTPEGRAKQKANNPGNSGRVHSDETRAKIRAARLVQKNVSTAGCFKQGNIPWNSPVTDEENRA